MKLSAIEAARHYAEPVAYCSDCAQWLGLSTFIRRSNVPRGRGSRCKPCQRRKSAAWRAEHPTYFRDHRASATHSLRTPSLPRRTRRTTHKDTPLDPK